MPTITTAVRALRPGDVILEPLPSPVGGANSYVVLDLAIAEPGPVGLQLGRLGSIAPHLNRVATVAWSADAMLEVVRDSGRVPVDALLEASRNTLARWDRALEEERHDEQQFQAFVDAGGVDQLRAAVAGVVPNA